ncbi:MAG: hypothetical protein NVSMB17_14550 [Candidatus Dormibacteria bacterium]
MGLHKWGEGVSFGIQDLFRAASSRAQEGGFIYVKKLLGTFAVLALALSGFTLIGSAPAFAASACQAQSTVTSSSSTSAPNGTVTLSATFKDCAGGAVQGATVTFSQTSGPCAATISPVTATTDANGVATATVTLPSCPGNYSFAAGTQGVTVRTTVVVTGGFPATSSAAAPAASALPVGALVMLAGGVVLALCGIGALALRGRRN